ncbi:hypothetical protein HBH51_256750 [Parastagonospora nodorum]|nr:hypothetical protein HBH51_256750 [Parastagonospora nodorum]
MLLRDHESSKDQSRLRRLCVSYAMEAFIPDLTWPTARVQEHQSTHLRFCTSRQLLELASPLSLRARTLINLSAVLYEQSAAQPSLPAEVGNMDLDFVPGVAFIPNVYIADSLRARTPINLSAVLLRARTLINLSAVLYEQAAARTGLPAEVGNISSTSLTALLNPRSLALKRPASSGSDLDRGRTNPTIAGQISLVKQLHNRIKTDEDCKKSTHRQGFNGSSSDDDDVQLVGDNMKELICVGKVKHTYVQAHTVPYPDPKKYLGNSTGNNRNNLNIMVTNPTSREFGRVDMKSSTRLSGEGPPGSPFSGLISMTLQLYCKRKWAHNIGNFQTDQFTQQGPTPEELGSIYVLRSVDEIWADVANVFDTVVSKSDKVPTQEPSSHIKTELYLHQKQALYFMLRDNGRKFYRLVITSEDTHCKQIIKKAYIMSPERASLILFMT